MPRKKRRTHWRQERFLDAIERRSTFDDACLYAGVHRTTPYKWAADAETGFDSRWNMCVEIAQRRLLGAAHDYALAGDAQLLKFLITRNDRRAERQTAAAATKDIVTRLEIIGLDSQEGSYGSDFFALQDNDD